MGVGVIIRQNMKCTYSSLEMRNSGSDASLTHGLSRGCGRS